MKNGPYELVVAPTDYPGRKYRDRYVYEHHRVWWRRTGKLVPEGYVLHHKNEKKRDNRYSNLELKTALAHAVEHGAKLKAPKLVLKCVTCTKKFRISPRDHHFRLKRGQKNFFCSRSCQVKHQWKTRIRRATHGMRSMYTGHGCRCLLCKKAQSTYMRTYKGS